MDEKEYKVFEQKLRAMKVELFGDDTFIIHTREMTRPNRAKDPRNKKLVHAEFRQRFYSKLNALIAQTDFKIVTSVIRKEKIISEVWNGAEDPYIFSFDFLLNRILHHCSDGTCNIFPEKRTHNEDIKLELALLKTKNTGTKLFRGAEVSRKVTQFVLTDKNENKSGLQLADLVVTPIGRYILGKAPKLLGNEIEYQIVKKKMAEEDLLIFP